jgi:DNA polymerase-3 subunit alpha
MGIKVLAPDVNQSFHEFAVVPHANDKELEVRFGLDAIKNVGHGAVAEIIRAREEQGEFTSIVDFITKVNGRLVNRKVWESLIKSGALDRFGERGALLEILDDILATGAKLNKNIEEGQTDLFGSDDSAVVPKLDITIPEKSVLYSEHEYLQWERQLLGLYLSSHPLEAFDTILSEKAVPLSEINPENDKKQAIVGGTIADIRQITTKNGQAMAFVKLEDIAGDERELVVFPTVFKATSDIWQRDKVLLASGKINGTDKLGQAQTEAKLLVDSAQIVTLEEANNYQPSGKKPRIKISKKKVVSQTENDSSDQVRVMSSGLSQENKHKNNNKLFIRLSSSDDNQLLQNLKSTMDSFPGELEAVLVIGVSKQAIRLPMKVNYNDELKTQLTNLVGSDNIKLN